MNRQPVDPAQVESSSALSNELDAAQLFDALAILQQNAYENPIDEDEVERVSGELLQHFLASPEAADFEQPLEGPRMLVQFAAIYQGNTIIAMSGRDLEAVLFEIIPAKVSAGSEIAHNVIQTSRALYLWMGREFALEQSGEMVELLGEDAARELEERMADPANYGPAKAQVMEALAAGVDLSDRQALHAFMMSRMGMRSGQSESFGDPYYDGFDPYAPAPATVLTPEQQRTRQKKRKKDRKSARKARKKNR